MAGPSLKDASMSILKVIILVIVVLAVLGAVLHNVVKGSTFANLHVDWHHGIDGFFLSLMKDLFMVIYDLVNGFIKAAKEFSTWVSKQIQSSSK